MAPLVHGCRVMVRLCLLAVLGVALATARHADACDCASPRLTCEALARADVVFVGTVQDVVDVAGSHSEITVAVEEVFGGSPGKTALIKARSSSATCDYGGYKVGERMLIFARSGPSGALSVSGCSRTAPIARAAADLAELRRAAKRGTGRVSGWVAMADRAPRANIEVHAVGTQLATLTDAHGGYQLDLPPGLYTIQPKADPDFAPRTPSQVEIGAPGACATLNFTEQWNGRIRGTLRDRKGKPAANVLVRAFPPSTTVPPVLENASHWTIGTSARTDANGAYELGPLPPGTYRVAVGAPFDPTDPIPATYHATDIAVPRGGLASGIDLVLPPRLKMHTLTARVAVDGNVPRFVNLDITMTELASKRTYQRFRSLPPVTADFTEAAGTSVELKACANELDCTKPVRVRLDKDVTVDLVLTFP